MNKEGDDDMAINKEAPKQKKVRDDEVVLQAAKKGAQKYKKTLEKLAKN